jgi:putative exosortase-associated protein (TIGR04073 family)
MNTKLFGALVVATVVASSLCYASTDEPPSGHNAVRKLGRGCANLLFGVVEMPNQYTKAVSEHGGAAGVTYGVPKGFVRWIGRELVGVYEIVTFPIPFPHGYRPVMKPEFPNEDYEP